MIQIQIDASFLMILRLRILSLLARCEGSLDPCFLKHFSHKWSIYWHQNDVLQQPSSDTLMKIHVFLTKVLYWTMINKLGTSITKGFLKRNDLWSFKRLEFLILKRDTLNPHPTNDCQIKHRIQSCSIYNRVIIAPSISSVKNFFQRNRCAAYL